MPNKRKKEIYEKLDEFLNQEIEIDEEILEITLKANEFYSKAVKKYIRTVAVIEFNTIKFIKDTCANFKTREQLNNWIVDSIKAVTSKKELTRTEEIELRTLKDFKHKVLDGHGKEYDITKGFNFDYGTEKVEFEPIKLGDKDNQVA